MSKNYFLNNPHNKNVSFLRKELHKALAKEQFIEEIPIVKNEIIEIKENNSKAKLKKVFINELNYRDDKSQVSRIWKINLEKDISGISTSSKTPECAILVLQKYENSYRLNILLIELKSFLDNKKLTEIEEKFACGMSRLYLLLVLNNHLNPVKGYNEDEIYIQFKGVLFYQNSKFNDDDNSQLLRILKDPNKSGILTCKTLLKDQDKIKIKCFKEQNKNEIKISLGTLL